MPRSFLLDTHVVVEISSAASYAALPSRVRQILEDDETELLLSIVSEAEIAIKSSTGKLDLTRADLERLRQDSDLLPYPLTRAHIDVLFSLPFHHRDPFDRMLIATALADDIALLSRDEIFRQYPGLRVIW